MEKPKMRPLIIIAAIVAALAILTIDSNFRLTVTRYTAGTPRLPKGFEGYKIVTLSDQHGALFGSHDGYLLDQISKLEPDIITVTGDFITDEKDLPAVREMLAGLVKIAPVYVVSGNHDWAGGRIHALADIFAETGATYLRNEYLTLERAGETVVLCGVEDPNGWADMIKPDGLVSRVREEYPDEYLILLGHRNYWIDVYPELDADLILCGHGHGGIIRLPFIGGVLDVNRKLFPKYADGLHESGTYQMIVSRGLGGYAICPRFLNNPEIALVTLA
jgi:predicted MPP superfamily phosphohydrolase